MTRVYDICIFPAPYHLGPKRQGCVCGSLESYPPGLQVKNSMRSWFVIWLHYHNFCNFYFGREAERENKSTEELDIESLRGIRYSEAILNTAGLKASPLLSSTSITFMTILFSVYRSLHDPVRCSPFGFQLSICPLSTVRS